MSDRLSQGFEPVNAKEWVMVALAVLNLAILAGGNYTAWLPQWIHPILVYADLAILAIFGLEFVTRLLRAKSKKGFVVTHWYDAVALLPVASGSIRALRLVRLLRIFTVKRTQWDGEPNWMVAFFKHVLRRNLTPILAVLTRPLLAAMIAVVEAPLRKARFAALVGDVLDKQRAGIEAVTIASMRAVKPTKAMADLGITKKAVHLITDSVLDTVTEVLRSDELNDLMADAVGDVLRAAGGGMEGDTKNAGVAGATPVAAPQVT